MKAILEFNIPEEQYQLGQALLSTAMFEAARNVEDMLRAQIKHGNPAKDREVMEDCIDALAEVFARM